MFRKAVFAVALTCVILGGYLGFLELKKPGRFPLRQIHLDGVVNSDVEETLAIINVEKGVNLFTIDLDGVKKNLLTLPWMRTVQVKRVFPDSLSITIKEKVAVCMGKDDERLSLLDEYGLVIKEVEARDPLVFPVVATTGRREERPEKAVWIINLLGRHPWLKEKVSEAIGYAGNRWVLYTDKGIKIILSGNADHELELLMRLQKRYDILNRRVRQVELRIPGRVAVRVAEDDVFL